MISLSINLETGRKIVTAGRLKFELIRGSGFMAQTICGDFPAGTKNRKQKILKQFAKWGIVVKQ
tara:strand:+ start:660 stop:851 length:192 start_codon:yes stop_codon:yes gene_type:complete